ncbi:MAG TPA: nuclease-related domain-containing protein [Acidimicrobiales bacterium]
MCADLSDNRPGESARRKADELKNGSPIRTALARILNVHTDEKAWRKGSKGEEEVASRLLRLGDGWFVLHAVQVREEGTDIDHVVIGPSGVFTLNTKNHLGKSVTVYERAIYVSGMKLPYIAASRSEGKRSSQLLTAACGFDVKAQSVIVVMANELKFKGYPKDVDVVARKKIATWLNGQPAVLEPDRVLSIYSAARQSSTWLPSK